MTGFVCSEIKNRFSEKFDTIRNDLLVHLASGSVGCN